VTICPGATASKKGTEEKKQVEREKKKRRKERERQGLDLNEKKAQSVDSVVAEVRLSPRF